MSNLMLPKLLAILTLAVACAEEQAAFDYPESLYGRYEVVSLRMDSSTASMAPGLGAESPVGKFLEIDEYGFHLSDMSCESGRIESSSEPIVFLDDPNLADLNIPPLSDPSFRGEQRNHQAYEVVCDGSTLTQLHQVDDQVLVMPWANSSQYLILEKPLSSDQIVKLQEQLKDMKFLSQDSTGVLDEKTLFAIGLYAGYRLKDNDAPQFQRTAITENLLDGLGVLDPKKL